MAEPLKFKHPQMESLRDYLTERGLKDAGDIAARYFIEGWYSVFEYYAEDPNNDDDKIGHEIIKALAWWAALQTWTTK